MRENALIKPSRTRDFGVERSKKERKDDSAASRKDRSKSEKDLVYTIETDDVASSGPEEVENHEAASFELNALTPHKLFVIEHFLGEVASKQEADPNYSVDDEPIPDRVARVAEDLGLHIKDITNETIELSGSTEAGYGTSRLYSNSDYLEFLQQVLLSHAEQGILPTTISWGENEDEKASEQRPASSADLPEDAERAMDEVREQTREQLAHMNEVAAPHAVPSMSSNELPEDVLEKMREGAQRARRELAGTRKEKVEEAHPKETFDHRFTTEFNITEEELFGIDGFEHLTVPQQKLLFENLSQSVYGQVKSEARIRTEGESKHAQETAQGTYIKRAWVGMKEALTKDLTRAAHEKEIAGTARSAGLEAHRPTLEFLIKSMARSGPRVHETEEGELLVDFVNIREWARGPERKHQKLAVQKVNQAAHALAKLPSSWKRHTLGVDESREWKITSFIKGKLFTERKQELEYRAKEDFFEVAKQSLAESLAHGGVPDTEIVKTLIAIDTKVKQLQFIQTSPDAVEALGAIPNQSLWYGAAKSVIGNGGVGYMALGYVGRTVLGSALGFFAAPLVSSAIAGVRSWNKTAAKLRERDRAALEGVKDTEAGALNIVSAGGDHGLIAKTQSLLESFYRLEMNKEVEPGKREEIEESQRKVLDRLRARVEYIQDKEGLSRIQYGTGADAMTNHAHLLELLGEASVLLADQQVPGNERLGARLHSYLERKEAQITDSRKAYRRKELIAQMIKAGGFSAAGALLAHFSLAGHSEASAIEEKPVVKVPPQETPLARAEEVKEAEITLRGNESFHHIEKGETLLGIMKQVPEFKGLKEEEILGRLKSLSSGELKAIGIRSGDINTIYAGEEIDIASLSSLIDVEVSGASQAVQAEDLGDFKGGAHELNSDELNRDHTIRESITDVSSMSEGSSIEDHSGNELIARSPEEVLALADKARSREIGTFLQRTYRIQENWNVIRMLRVSDVLTAVEKKDSWWEIFAPAGTRGTVSLPKMALDIRNTEVLLQQAMQPEVGLKPLKDETVEQFMERLTMRLAKEPHQERLPVLLQNIMRAFNKTQRVENI